MWLLEHLALVKEVKCLFTWVRVTAWPTSMFRSLRARLRPSKILQCLASAWEVEQILMIMDIQVWDMLLEITGKAIMLYFFSGREKRKITNKMRCIKHHRSMVKLSLYGFCVQKRKYYRYFIPLNSKLACTLHVLILLPTTLGNASSFHQNPSITVHLLLRSIKNWPVNLSCVTALQHHNLPNNPMEPPMSHT